MPLRLCENRRMLTLGIETSGRAGSVALLRDGQCLEERSLEKRGRRHAQTLVAEIDRLFRDFNERIDGCDNVAVSIGPGSFTGLRVGVVCAKTLAYAAGCQLAAVDTFASIAENSPPDVLQVTVIADAQRGDLYVGRFRRTSATSFTRNESGIFLADEKSWCEQLTAIDVISGTGIEKLDSKTATRCRLLEPEYRCSRASVIAKLGEAQIQAGHADDYRSLEPFYLRASAAEENWNQTRGK